MSRFVLAVVLGLSVARAAEPQPGEMAGYLLVPHARVDPAYGAGFSMYVAAWPLLKDYPGDRFQSGLFGTWMFAKLDKPKPEKVYSDIEGGLGWWRDTRFATETPKFIMGGVALNFVEWANGPGAGKGRDWKNPKGQYAIAQLGNRVIWPPDGLNLKQGTAGELFGYGYLPLPLATGGGQCWTLFVNSGNHKGPIAFFLPEFWSRPTADKPELAGLFLDVRPSDPNKAVQMETQHVPARLGTAANGDAYARVAPVLFPKESQPLIHRITAYKASALTDTVRDWFAGGPAASGTIDATQSVVQTFESKGGATWRIYGDKSPKDEKVPVAWNSFATPVAIDPNTYGYRWGSGATAGEKFVTLPEYYRLTKTAAGKPQWQPVAAADVPEETGLAKVEFPRRRTPKPEAYVTPDDAASVWKTPGPAAGPFEAKLGDGSTATYFWYRFADQPALRHARITDAEREDMQKRVEQIHRSWPIDRDYLPPPTVGRVADLDPGVVVTPPKGLEVGYVPIVVRQAKPEGK